ncbi:DUF2721 domain-containing protein [Methylococcus sp. EFPC2]|uniref:DUF2721 domain-containing protein n=1 Tax=Methylococcus sp. EFPC2 TaxID=2812648 RepID=UPI001966DA07|nr:DUF2721 domain-containing protein [Methylococcus sp. EFPC2]QSA97101.1 DUF2721 domain-containing protein [Methylococcus sp. EFPC2]
MIVNDLIPLLQTSIGPVILISAVGLLLLTTNNRLAHSIDRVRSLSKDAEHASEPHKSQLKAQMAVLWRRTRMLRYSIEFASLSALFAALLIIDLFVTVLLGLQDAWLMIALLFVASLTCLIVSLWLLIMDVKKSLLALGLELSGNDRSNEIS